MLKKIITPIILFLILLISIITFSIVYIYWPRDVEIFGIEVPLKTTALDFTNCPIDENDDWIIKLGKLKYLNTVTCEDKTITKDKKNMLEEMYPNIQFNIIPTIEIFGLNVREDAEEIDLSSSHIEDTSIIIDSLKQFPDLKKVNLLNQKLAQDLQFELMQTYPNISFEWNVEIAGKTVEYSITSLDLSNAQIEDLDSFKNALKLLPNLNYLDMSDCNLSNETLASLREQFPNIKIVWTVYFGIWKTKTDAIAFSVLIRTFNYTRMKSEDLEPLKYCTDLQALDLGHQAITDISFIADNFPELRILILADNKITDISPLSKLKHLHYLELFINRVSDLSPLIQCKELVDLNLCYNGTLSNISPLLNNDFPNLERIWISHCGISSYNYSLLKKKYPKAKIITSGAGSTNDGWRTHDRYYSMINMFYKQNYISELFTKYDT